MLAQTNFWKKWEQTYLGFHFGPKKVFTLPLNYRFELVSLNQPNRSCTLSTFNPKKFSTDERTEIPRCQDMPFCYFTGIFYPPSWQIVDELWPKHTSAISTLVDKQHSATYVQRTSAFAFLSVQIKAHLCWVNFSFRSEQTQLFWDEGNQNLTRATVKSFEQKSARLRLCWSQNKIVILLCSFSSLLLFLCRKNILLDHCCPNCASQKWDLQDSRIIYWKSMSR